MNNQTNTNIDALVKTAVFSTDSTEKKEARGKIRQLAASQGIIPASIQGLYEASGKGLYKDITVPAINIRGIAYDTARAVFRAAMKDDVGALIFEIARSEIGYTDQSPEEYTTSVLAAAIREGYRGPVFIQGDHFQVNRKKYGEDPAAETTAMKTLIKDAIDAGFYNIDIDASTLVDIEKTDLVEQQDANSKITAELTGYIREIEPEGVTVSVGGEIGEIGKGNSTVADLRAFMEGYRNYLGSGVTGISKISVQTGTSHGGVVLPDGSIAQVKIDFDVLKELSLIAKKEYNMGGAVQHGASTLPDEAFDMFTKSDTLEVHLATGFQNIIYDSKEFPDDLRQEIYAHLAVKYNDERKEGETDEQFYYKTRKKALGDYKKELWNLPDSILGKIMTELENRFTMMFHKLNAVNTTALVEKYVKYS
ncbi:MAG: class II fructose-bisphosphate aldolase [Dehalococcoidia bacterium]|jgi:fructose/tagatose bisphosphate aldolase